MISKKTNIALIIALILLLVVIAFLVNNNYILSKVEDARNAEIAELEAKVKNLQSRINANTTLIENSAR